MSVKCRVRSCKFGTWHYQLYTFMAKRDNKNTQKDLPKVHKELSGLDITINSFGEINMSVPIEKVNEFLNKHVDDKKLRNLPNTDNKE
jgi:hypothetical protein